MSQMKNGAADLNCATKTKKTSNKRNSSKTGLSVRESLEQLTSHISLAKGLLATLSTQDPSAWTRKCSTRADQEHTRILLQEVMDEIWNADSTALNLNQALKKKYHGICLL